MSSWNSGKKVVLVTGASSGIGRETALALARQGHRVVGAARRTRRMDDLVSAGGRALPLDVTDPLAVEAVVRQVLADEGRLDVLVNNAGYATYGAVEDTTLEDARRQFEVNLFGVAAMTRAVLPHMRERRSGRIVNVSSMGGRIYTPLGAWYHAAKHALEGWSDCLRLELAPFGIQVVVIEPGLIATEFGEVMSGPMLERSGSGPYAGLARAVAEATRETYAAGGSSPPSVVARAIVRAIEAGRPGTRYAPGRYARLLIGLRKWLGDGMFDRVVMSQLNRMR